MQLVREWITWGRFETGERVDHLGEIWSWLESGEVKWTRETFVCVEADASGG